MSTSIKKTLNSAFIIKALFVGIALTAVKSPEILALRQILNISTPILYTAIIALLFFYYLLMEKMSWRFLLPVLVLLVFFLINKLLRIYFFHEVTLVAIEFGFLLYFIIFYFLYSLQNKSFIKNLTVSYVFATNILLVYVCFQDPSAYGKFNETIQAFNYPFVPIGMNKNSFSLILITASLICVIWIKSNNYKFLNFLLILIFTGFIVFLRTRSHVPLLVGIWVWLLLGEKNPLILILGAFVSLTAFYILYLNSDYFVFARTSDSIRTLMTIDSTMNLFERPITGAGIDLLTEQNKLFSTSDHNQFSMFSGFFGVFGLLIMLLFIVLTARSFLSVGTASGMLLASTFLLALAYTPFIFNLGTIIAIVGLKLLDEKAFEKFSINPKTEKLNRKFTKSSLVE